MISIKNILVPTDFSDASSIALRYGKEFATTFGATLHVAHVVEEVVLDYYAWTSGGMAPALSGVRADMEQSSNLMLDKFLTPEEQAACHAKLITLTGSPFVEIVRYARTNDIDLIVIGTHGRGAIAHMLLGSVAERVVRKAPCPVLTVRPEEHEFVMP